MLLSASCAFFLSSLSTFCSTTLPRHTNINSYPTMSSPSPPTVSANTEKQAAPDVFMDITVMPSSLLRGTTLVKYHTVMTIAAANVADLNQSSLHHLLVAHFKTIYRDDVTNGATRNIVHYLSSKKLRLLVFRKSRSKNCLFTLDSANDFNSLKSILKIKNKIKFVVTFVKVSTVANLGIMQVRNAVIDKLEKEFKLSGVANSASSKSSGAAETVSIESKITTEAPPPQYNTDSSTPFDSEFASNLPIEQIDYLVDTIKSYLDPVNIDKHIGALLECITDLKNNLSTNIEPLNQKLDGLCNTVLQMASTSSDAPLRQFQDLPVRSATTHTHVLCDGCDKPIVGCRFKCLQCHDYDLCEACDAHFFESQKHLKTHQMIRISLDEAPILSPKVETIDLDNATISFDGGLTSFPLKDTYSFELFKSNPDPNLTKLLDAKVWIEDRRYLTVSINSTLSSPYVVLLTATFKNDVIPSVKDLRINLHDASKLISVDPFGPSVPTSMSRSISLDLIDVFYLTVESNSKEYLFEYSPITSASSQITGEFHLTSDAAALDVLNDEPVADSNSNSVENLIVIDEDDVSLQDDTLLEDVKEVNALYDVDSEGESDVESNFNQLATTEENTEIVEAETSGESETESDATPSISNSTIASSPVEVFHSAVLSGEDKINLAHEANHEFELLGYYLLDFNTNELEVRVRSTIEMDPKELISLSILDFEGSRFTSELVNQGNNILIARFPNWSYGDFQLEIREAIVHYKAQDYDIFTNTVSPTPDMQLLPKTSMNEVAVVEMEDVEPSAVEGSSLVIPLLDSQQDGEYVFISRTESLVDDNASDYSVLSLEED